MVEPVYACDAVKRDGFLRLRGFDLLDLAAVFEDPRRIDKPDRRRDYGEERRVVIGRALGRIYTVVYTWRDPVIWLITGWPANRKERSRYEVE